MTATTASPEIRSGFDYSALPLGDNARVLSLLATKLVERALDGAHGLDPSPLLGLTGHAIYIEKGGTPLTKPLAFSWRDRLVFLRRRLVGLSSRLIARFLPTVHEVLVRRAGLAGYRSLVRTAVKGRLTPRARRLLLEERLAKRMGEGWLIPDELWDLVAHTAWTEPRFHFGVQRRIREHLRTRIVMEMGAEHRPRFDVRTFWLMTALIVGEDRGWRARLIPGRARQRRRLADYRRLALRKALGTREWAGFWDQWLIALHLRGRPELVFALDSAAAEAVMCLPLLARAGIDYGLDARVGGTALADPEWEAGIPAWIEGYFDVPEEVPRIEKPLGLMARLWRRLRPRRRKQVAEPEPNKNLEVETEHVQS